MCLTNSDLLKMMSSIIKENFPNQEGISIRMNKNYEIIVEIHIDDAEYVADRLSCDLNLNEISNIMEKELKDIGDDRPVIIRRNRSLYSYTMEDLNKLASCC